MTPEQNITPEQALKEMYVLSRRTQQMADQHDYYLQCYQVVQQRLQEFDALQAEAKSQPDEPKDS